MKHLRWLMATALAVTVTACSLFTDLTDPTIALNIPDGSFVRPGDVIVATAEDQESGIARLEALFNTGSKDLKAIPEGERDRTPVTVEFTIPTDVAVGVEYDIEIIATNGVGRIATETYQVTIAASADDTTAPITSAPEVRWQAPVPGSVLGGVVELRVKVASEAEIEGVEFEIANASGAIVVDGSEISDGVYAYAWDTLLYPKGTYAIKATAVDASNRRGSSSASYTVDQEADAPIALVPRVGWVSPAPSSELSGTVDLVASVDAPAGVGRVEFDVTNAGGTVTLAGAPGAPGEYGVTWATGAFPSGAYTVTVRVVDLNARIATATAAFTVASAPPVPGPKIEFGAPFSGSTLSGAAGVAFTVDAPAGVADVRLVARRAGGASAQSIGALAEAGGAYSIVWTTPVWPNGDYVLTASVVDDLGRAASVDLDVILDNSLTAYWLAPAPNTTASATTTLVVDALGGAELERAVFTYVLDGDTVQIGIDEDSSDGLSIDWTTTGLAAGIYTVSADLRDVTGRVAVASVDVVVPAATEDDLPDVIWATPAAGALLTGPAVTELAFDVTAPAGVAAVQAFLVAADADRTAITPLVDAGGGRYEATLDPALLPAGSYALVAEVRDLEGRVATAARAVMVAEQLPWVAFTSPTPDKRTAGILRVAVDFEALRGAKRVDVFLSGVGGPVLLLSEDDAVALAAGTAAVELSTVDYESGDYTLRAVIEDLAGNVEEVEIAVVFLTPFVITNPIDGDGVGGGRRIVSVVVGVNGTILNDFTVDQVEIFLNGLSAGLATIDTSATENRLAVFVWDTAVATPGHAPAFSGDRVVTAKVRYLDPGLKTTFTPGVLVNYLPLP